MIAVAALALFVLLVAGALIGRMILAVSKRVFDVLLGEQHDDLIDWELR